MALCSVCQTEYVEGQINLCTVCGWDLTPDSFFEQVQISISHKERVRLAWARGLWSWAKEIQSQLQLQSDLSEIQEFLQQSNQDREHLQSQLSQVLEQTSQKQLQELISTIFLSDARFTELQAHLQQTQQKISQLQSDLATGGSLPSSSIITIYCLGTEPGEHKWLNGRTENGTVELAPSLGGGYTGTRWALYKDSDYSYLYCLGTGPGDYRWLDGRTGNGTVGLAPSREGRYTGTRCSPILIV